MQDSYLQLFGTKPPHNMQSPLEPNNHPELDDSPLLEKDDVQKYQSLIGQMQWSITTGRIDITTAVIGLSSFHAAPHQGHMEQAKHVFGYLTKMKDAVI